MNLEDKFSHGPAERKITYHQVRLPQPIKLALDKGIHLQLAVIRGTLFLGNSSFLQNLASFIPKELYYEPPSTRPQKYLDLYQALPFQYREYVSQDGKYYWPYFYLVGYQKGDHQTETRLFYRGMIDKPKTKTSKTKLHFNNLEKYGFGQEGQKLLFLNYPTFFEIWDKDTILKYYTLLELYPQETKPSHTPSASSAHPSQY